MSHVFKVDQHILRKLKASSNDEERNKNSHVRAEAENSSAQTVDQCHSCQGKLFLKTYTRELVPMKEAKKQVACTRALSQRIWDMSLEMPDIKRILAE